ncbi:Dihydroxyacetone kinase, ATP-dependent [Pseudomonas syringae pv. avellanae str. ISPaVe013]|uniref:dihydroxyacetone kinase subunit DhaL n=1 Tax=Pseudomonas syringae TaxID=317 RepID=UPI00028D871E|nr:dihydroxyacetone kinase subunit DhaL [Pseudomonas syringae]EKG40172.1 Dihydroxyacetone kinase, ATP-dependent [Pseudomonas syringae pv. avellanae str. ISPaVe013]
MKKLINNPHAVVDDMLEGVVLADHRLSLLEGDNIVVRSDFQTLKEQGKVALISGGGAGHEPAHGGYVGPGMLTAAVAGPVFTSPSVDAIVNAIVTVAGPAGVLLIVKNYTGDRLNFGLAAEIARTSGIDVNVLVVGDDVALDDTEAYAGRRGIAGTVLIHKVAGAGAEAGLSLQAVTDQAQQAADRLFSMGLGLGACTVPAAGKPGFVLEDDQVEYGLGIHGESGVRREAIERADVMIKSLVDRIVSQGHLQHGQRVALLVNNLGGTSVQELDIVARQALHECSAHGLVVELVMVGTFLTALEMAGCSLSLLGLDDETVQRLLAPSQTTAWPGMTRPAERVVRVEVQHRQADLMTQGPAWPAANARRFRATIEAVTAALKSHEQVLTELDSVVGDGDIGISLARGAQAIDAALADLALDRPAMALQQISAILRKVLGGTSGPLYAVFVLRAGVSLASAASVEAPGSWADAFSAGCQAMQQLGGANAGDRTMLDALLPAADALSRLAADVDAAYAAREVAVAADAGAQATRDLLPRKGRSSYLGQRALGHIDPGAYAVALWTQAIAQALE